MKNVLFVLCFAMLAVPVRAQSGLDAPPPPRELSLAGPRIGFTVLSDGVVKKLADDQIKVGPSISQFGWQFERQFYSKRGGVTALNEWVVLLGGLDQGVAIPSLSWLVGMRSREGAE